MYADIDLVQGPQTETEAECYTAQTGGTAYSNSHIPDIFKVRQDRPGQICNLTPLFSFKCLAPIYTKLTDIQEFQDKSDDNLLNREIQLTSRSCQLQFLNVCFRLTSQKLKKHNICPIQPSSCQIELLRHWRGQRRTCVLQSLHLLILNYYLSWENFISKLFL